MKILVTGATGFVGTKLCHKLFADNHEVIALTRSKVKALAHFSLPIAAITEQELSLEFINSLDGVINLKGENIAAKRWSQKQKNLIWSSRVDGTKNLVKLLNERKTNLKFFIQASAIGFYPINQTTALTEDLAAGNEYLSKLCNAWEKEAQQLEKTDRLVINRIGVVLGKEGGALAKLLPIFKLGGGGPIGNGKMKMSWIHVDDLVEIFFQEVNNVNYKGIFNAVSPEIITNTVFTKALAKAVGMPAIFPVPEFMLKLIFGEMSTIMLDGQIVDCQNLKKLNHQFLFPNIQNALDDIVKKRVSDKNGKKKTISST